MITAKEFAERLNGRRYGSEMTREEKRLAWENNLLVVFGASDDLVEFRGLFDDETGCYNGGFVYLSRRGIPENDCDNEKCPYYDSWLKDSLSQGKVVKIKVFWCGKSGEEKMDSRDYETLGKPTWCFDFSCLKDAPPTFDIFDGEGEEREYYCRGVVIDMNTYF